LVVYIIYINDAGQANIR